MQSLVEYIAKALVADPDQVQVTEVERDNETVYELKVGAEDTGRVIGKQGRVARAIRTIVKAAATKNGMRVHVEIVD